MEAVSLLLKYVCLFDHTMHKTTFLNILINYPDIKPKRDKYVTSLKYCELQKYFYSHTFVWAKDGSSQETVL